MVPMPASESTSIKMEWGMRPSRMWARFTPSRTDSTQHSILGIIPPEKNIVNVISIISGVLSIKSFLESGYANVTVSTSEIVVPRIA